MHCCFLENKIKFIPFKFNCELLPGLPGHWFLNNVAVNILFLKTGCILGFKMFKEYVLFVLEFEQLQN